MFDIDVRLRDQEVSLPTADVSSEIAHHASFPVAENVRRPTGVLLRAIDGRLKRFADAVGALAILVALAPLFAGIAILVSIDGGPILFSHRRVGRGLRPFGCFKFRTMMLGAESCLEEYLSHHPDVAETWRREHKLEPDPRITGIGRMLRATSLDELPQLLNVVAGSMSLVGPRPVTTQEVPRYGHRIGHYASVRPGLTGPWQIGGRSELGYDERVRLDSHYATSRTIWTDASILFATPGAVLSRRGAK